MTAPIGHSLRWSTLALGWGLLATPMLLLTAGCHHQPRAVYAPPPPPLPRSHQGPAPPTTAHRKPQPGQSESGEPQPAPTEQRASPGLTTAADLAYVASHAPVYTETGTASWYGPPYNRRRGANGQIFDQDALTAAHRTLPMNSLVRVTDLATGRQAVMHVTDRGPFVRDRILDLSVASAKEIGVYLPGTAPVRIEVFSVPAPIETGGRWCVQIGAFKHGDEADKLRKELTREYDTANVIEFTGPTGHWVRIRPAHDDKDRAIEIAHSLQPAEGTAYLVRLD